MNTLDPPMLVLLPGLDGTGKRLTCFIDALGEHVAHEIIGYPDGQPLGYEELELRVREALPKDRPFVLLGESFGGPIAMRIAATAPPGMVGVVLCGTFAKNPYRLLGWASPLICLFPLKSMPRWLRALLMWGSCDPGRAPAQSERAIAGLAAGVLRRRLSALLSVDASERARRITLPALILYARHDRLVPYRATACLSSLMPHAELVAVDGPHLLLQAVPSECAAVVTRFVSDLPRA